MNTTTVPTPNPDEAALVWQSGLFSSSSIIESATEHSRSATFSCVLFGVKCTADSAADYIGNRHLPNHTRYVAITRPADDANKYLLRRSGQKYVRAIIAESTWSLNSERIRKLLDALRHLSLGERTSFRDHCNQRTVATPPPTVTPTSLIDGIRRHPNIRHGVRLAARLEHLLAISREEQPAQAPPAIASLISLTAFLSAHPELVYPTTVLTPDGNVRVQWRRGASEHFAIEFLGDHDVRFVIFAPDPRHRYKTNRVSGSATVESVMTLAAPYGVMEWATEQERQNEYA